ncbi:MAG: hypothetical protein R3A47_09065 [Polyangiales bacterium]
MARRRRWKSISIPIVLGAITVPLAAALLVGWAVLIGKNIARSEQISGDVWLLVLGVISFLTIMVVLVLFSFSVARGILEVRKQDIFIDSVTHERRVRWRRCIVFGYFGSKDSRTISAISCET